MPIYRKGEDQFGLEQAANEERWNRLKDKDGGDAHARRASVLGHVDASNPEFAESIGDLNFRNKFLNQSAPYSGDAIARGREMNPATRRGR